MRSRFSAFATANVRYLLDSWHQSTRPQSLELDSSLTWFRLDILSASGGNLLDSSGTVEFIAFYREETPAGRVKGQQQERSSFVKENGRWYYLGALELSQDD
jgi:SEC-C motif-containing protein